MVEEMKQQSPELASLDAAIEIRKKILRIANSAFWAPTIALQSQVKNVYSKWGKGTEPPPTFKVQNLSWNIGINASLPLFSGGEKFATRRKAIEELKQLEIERDATEERLEQRIRAALHIAGASNASIQQAKLAAEAARKSLNVVLDSYSEGLVSIVELLDVQNAALVTDKMAASTVYSFIIDLMEVERAMGGFTFFLSDKECAQFYERADAYFVKSGLSIK